MFEWIVHHLPPGGFSD